MAGTIGILGARDKQLDGLVRAMGMRPITMLPEHLAATIGASIETPDLLLVDLRHDSQLLALIPTIKRRHPAMAVAIVCAVLDPTIMLEALRAGVTECLADPLTEAALDAAVRRVIVQRASPVEGRVFAIVGAKGGVGGTMLAVNIAEALAKKAGEALLIDLQLSSGDAAVFLGIEPRFTVVEALENTHRLDETFFRSLVTRTKSGLSLLAASGRASAGPIDVQRVRALIDFAVRCYPCVVLDVPRMEWGIIDALESASSIFVVVNQELATLRNASRVVSRLRQRYGSDRISLLVNRSDRQSEISLEDIQKAAGARIKFVFPSDYRLALTALNKGQALAGSGQGRLSASFHEFVRELGSSGEKEPPVEDSGGLFGWLTPRRSTAG